MTHSASGTTDLVHLEVVPRRRHGRWLGTILTGSFVAWVFLQLVTNAAFQWDVVGDYVFAPIIIDGLRNTIALTGSAMVIGISLGLLLAIMRLSSSPVLKYTSSAYVWFFRGTPTLVQLIFWFNLAALYPILSFGLPFGGPKIFAIDANLAITPFVAALFGLGLNESAYMAEIVRGGLLGVDPGQILAAKSIGMTPRVRLRRIILPQAMKMIIPPTGNQVIGMLKWSSLASVVSYRELLLASQTVYNRTFQVIPLLIVASLWYLVVTSLLSTGQRYVEQYYSRGIATPKRGVEAL